MKDKHDDPFYGIEDVTSFQECTGLMPALPRTEEENENYAALYAVHKGRQSEKVRRKKNEGCDSSSK